MEILVYIPSMLAHCTGGDREVMVQGAMARGCLDNLMERYPLLITHVFDTDGRQRQHVSLYYNRDNLRWYDDWDIPVRNGDSLTILQAVSGG